MGGDEYSGDRAGRRFFLAYVGLSAQSWHEGPLRLKDPRRQPGHEPVRIKRAHVGARRPLLLRENPVEAKATFGIQVSASRLSMSSS
jgi:hypothetical protein